MIRRTLTILSVVPASSCRGEIHGATGREAPPPRDDEPDTAADPGVAAMAAAELEAEAVADFFTRLECLPQKDPIDAGPPRRIATIELTR